MEEQSRASLMQEGVAAAQSGDRSRAYGIFRQITEQEFNNEQAWIWLSATSDDPDEALNAARNALALNPDSEFAKEAETYALQSKEAASLKQAQDSREAAIPASRSRLPDDNADLIPDWLQDLSRAGGQRTATAALASEGDAPVTTVELPVSEQYAMPSAAQPLAEANDFAADSEAATVASPLITARPLRDNSRIEQRVTMAEERRRSLQAEQRSRSVRSVLVALVGITVVGLLIWGLYSLFANKPADQGLSNRATATVVPPTATVATSTPRVADTTATTLALIPTAAAQGTATAQAQAQATADANFAAQTFPTSTPGAAMITMDSGIASYKQGNYEQAVSLLEQAINQDRSLTLAHYYLGFTYLTLAQQPVTGSLTLAPAAPTVAASSTVTSSRTVTASVQASSPTVNPGVGPLVSLDPATAYQRAEIAFRNVVSLAPDWAGGYAGLANTLLRQRRFAEAVEPARQATRLDAGKPEYWLLLGQAYAGLGDNANAEQANAEAERLSPPVPGSTPRSTVTTLPTVVASPTAASSPSAAPSPTQAASTAASDTPAAPSPTADTPAAAPASDVGGPTATAIDLSQPGSSNPTFEFTVSVPSPTP